MAPQPLHGKRLESFVDKVSYRMTITSAPSQSIVRPVLTACNSSVEQPDEVIRTCKRSLVIAPSFLVELLLCCQLVYRADTSVETTSPESRFSVDTVP